MNETQEAFVDRIRSDQVSCKEACEDLLDLEPVAYTNAGFREMLFAIDAMNQFRCAGWKEVFVRGLIRHSDWVVEGQLLPRAYSEIAERQIEYGYGVYGVNLVLELFEEIKKKPANATSFTRRTFREYFNGAQPVDEEALFLLKRLLANQSPMTDEDIRLLFHIREETKGLGNAETFDHFFASTVREWVLRVGETSQKTRERLVLWLIESADEITNAEMLLIRFLKDGGVSMPGEVLRHIDLSRDQLMGIA